MKKGIDHSLTYKKVSFRNLTHIRRLKQQIKLSRGLKKRHIESYADFGCSNGFVTNEISIIVSPSKTYGFDITDNIYKASKAYPNYEFRTLDLNKPSGIKELFDFITCFETLEHVGKIEEAIQNLLDAIKQNGSILISVPIETGLIGLIKYLIKRIFFKYKYPFKSLEIKYIYYLLFNKNINSFRPKGCSSYGTHFGFDYRVIDTYLINNNQVIYHSFNHSTTRYYIINKKKFSSKEDKKTIK